jgi:WS/DGAT/MGAT family acyltransferase
LETEHAPLHFVGAAVYDPSTRAGGAIGLDDLKATMEKALNRLPLRKKLVSAPWRLDLPYWVDAEGFDLDDHVRELTLPPPGDRTAFLAVITALLEAPFDRSRPLWEMNLISDLDGVDDFPKGSFAVLVRVHHGQFDGTTALKLLNALHTDRPEPVDDTVSSWAPERTPTGPELLMRAPWHFVERMWRTAGVTSTVAPMLARRMGRRSGGASPARPPVPRTRFSSRLESHRRVFDFLHLPLDDVLAIRTVVEGATVNDVASTIAGGALRRYLESVDELPDEPLVVMMPISAHAPGSQSEIGNRISLMTATIHTEIADPLERLRLGREASARSKRASQEMGAGNIADLLDVLPTNALDLASEPLIRSGILETLPLPFSGISLTNVPGPREPLYFDGARMVTLLGATFLVDVMGLIIAITSYCDNLLVAFTSTPEVVPDSGFLADCFRQSYEELRDAAASSVALDPSPGGVTRGR